MASSKLYSSYWRRSTPGCLIILQDQSEAMGQKCHPLDRESYAATATRLLNEMLAELIRRNQKPALKGWEAIERLAVAVLGYGDQSVSSALAPTLDQLVPVSISQLASHPRRLERRVRRDIDYEGNLFDVDEEQPVWIDPVAAGNRPLCAALRQARELAAAWAAAHLSSFPPVVLNVTSGSPDDGELEPEVAALRAVTTDDGPCLLYHWHLGGPSDQCIAFPLDIGDVHPDVSARQLFESSSRLPERKWWEFSSLMDLDLVPGMRGYAHGNDADSARRLLRVVSRLAYEASVRPRPNEAPRWAQATPVPNGDEAMDVDNPAPRMPYTRWWSTTHPGCLVILLDQSAGMRSALGATLGVTGRESKAAMAARALNRALARLVSRHSYIYDLANGPRPCVEVTVLGYGAWGVRSALPHPLDKEMPASLPELHRHPLRLEMETRTDTDLAGNPFLVQEAAIPSWVDPLTEGEAPLCAALRRARELVETWAASHSESFPPVIVVVTSGDSSDGDPGPGARAVVDVMTRDGRCLLFWCHIADSAEPPVAFPSDPTLIPARGSVSESIRWSSPIPESVRGAIEWWIGSQIPPGGRGAVVNGNEEAVFRLLKVASILAHKPD